MNNIDLQNENTVNQSEEKFDKNKYLKKITQPQNIENISSDDLKQNESKYEPEKFDKNKYKQPYEPGIERHATRTLSRVGETIGGIPGDFIKFTKFIGGLLPKIPIPKWMEREPSFIQKYGKKALEMVPTSQDLKKASQEYLGLWTTPKDDYEKIGDEVIESFTNLMIPIGKQMGLMKAVASAGGGVIAKEVAKQYGAPEWAQESIKFGTTLGLSAFNPGGAKKYASNLYDLTEKAIPNNISVPGDNLKNIFTSLRNKLAKGGGESTKSPAEVIKRIDLVLNHIKNNQGRLNVKEGQAFMRNINEVIGDPETLERAKQILPTLNKDIRNTMGQVESTYPEYLKLLDDANSAFGAVIQGNKISNSVSEAIKKTPMQSTLGIAIASAYDPRIGVAATGAYALAESANIISQFTKSPALRKYYIQMLRKGLDKNKIPLMNTLKKIDKEALKEEKKQSK